MNTKILSAFREFMGSQNYSPSTIRQYIKSLDGLPDPTGYEPLILLRYIDDYLSANQPILTKYTYKNVRAALNALFFMCCGRSIRAFRKSHPVTDQYSSVLNSYKDYCISFLHLTEPVTLAAIREVHKFLVATVPDISCVDWSSITANTITEYISQNLSQLSPSSIGVSVTAIRRLFCFLYFCDVKIHQSILTLPLATPVWSKNGCLPIVLSDEEISRITKHYFASDSIGLRDKAVLYCFLELGLRCSEVIKPVSQEIIRERIRKFGQHDHLRVFGRDSAELLSNAGFKVTVIDGDTMAAEILPVIGPADYDSNKLFVCEKR